MNDGIVARQDRIDDQAADAGNGKDAFGHDHAPQQQGDADADDGDDRHRGVGQRVVEQQLATPSPFERAVRM